MADTILIAGFGADLTASVAERFHREGFQVALTSRNPEQLATAVTTLEGRGARATSFCVELSQPHQAQVVVKDVRAALGPISVLHWNAFAEGPGDLITADPDAMRSALDIGLTSLVAAVQEVLPDLKETRGAVLITTQAPTDVTGAADELASWGNMGLSLVNAARHELAGMLHRRLKPEGVFVGEVRVRRVVRGTEGDHGQRAVEAAHVADAFYELYRTRHAMFTQVG